MLQEHLGVESDNDASKHKKLGYRLFKDKYVNRVQVKPNVSKGGEVHFLIKACVSASMKQQSYNVYVHFNQRSGKVTHGSCTCKAGKGGCCKHVVAVLFQVIDYIQLELTEVPDDLTCTQILQQWHVPKTSEVSEPILYEDMTFEKPSYERDVKGRKRTDAKSKADNYNPTPHFARNITQNDIKNFTNNLKQQGKADYLRRVIESNDHQPHQFDKFHQNLPSKKQLAEFRKPEININDYSVREKMFETMEHPGVNWSYVDEKNVEFVKELSVTNQKLREVERNTRDQSTCDRWFEERGRRITSSNFGAVLKRRKSIYPKSILNNLLCRSNKIVSKACKWGLGKEEEAVKKYVKHKEREGKPVCVCSACGFVVNSIFPWLGASPDFVIDESNLQASSLGLGEIKCPFSKRDNTIKEACQDPNFFLTVADDKITLKQNHAYFYQIQGAMATLQLQWCDFVVYTSKDLFVERITFDSSFWEKSMVPELTRFYFEFVLPKLA